MIQIKPTPMLLTKKTGTKNERQVSGNYQELTSDNCPAFEHFSQKKTSKRFMKHWTSNRDCQNYTKVSSSMNIPNLLIG